MTDFPSTTENVNVSLSVVWHGAAGKFDARMSEISLDGCFIDSMGQEEMGETIDFNVMLPSGIWVSLKGEVIYQEYPVGFEVRFTERRSETMLLITRLVAERGGQAAQRLLAEGVLASEAEAPDETERILLADDDVMTLKMLTAIIEAEGFEAVGVSDGLEAFRILQKDINFAAAIVDMAMPHLDGMDLINYMKSDERTRSIPVGVVTGEQDPLLWDTSIAAGASVFLPKPFTPPQIQMMLRILIRKGPDGD